MGLKEAVSGFILGRSLWLDPVGKDVIFAVFLHLLQHSRFIPLLDAAHPDRPEAAHQNDLLARHFRSEQFMRLEEVSVPI